MTLVQGNAEGLAVDGSAEDLRGLSLDVTDGTLTITNPDTRRWWLEFMGRGEAGAHRR